MIGFQVFLTEGHLSFLGKVHIQLRQSPCLLSTNFVDIFVHVHGNLKSIEHMNRVLPILSDDIDIWFPHLTAYLVLC